MTATLTKWYEERGRHEIFAGGKNVNLDSKEHSLVLDPEAVAAGIQTDLDAQGIAKNARQEKLAARAAAKGANGNGAAKARTGPTAPTAMGRMAGPTRTPPTTSRWRRSTASTC